MKNWLIRKLGGIPRPEKGITLLVLPDKEIGHNEIHINGGKDEVVYYCGGFPFPQVGEGYIVVGPVVRRLPVRKEKTVATVFATAPDGQLEELEKIPLDAWPPNTTVARSDTNLCDSCCATAQDCRKATKVINSESNTGTCDQYK